MTSASIRVLSDTRTCPPFSTPFFLLPHLLPYSSPQKSFKLVRERAMSKVVAEASQLHASDSRASSHLGSNLNAQDVSVVDVEQRLIIPNRSQDLCRVNRAGRHTNPPRRHTPSLPSHSSAPSSFSSLSLVSMNPSFPYPPPFPHLLSTSVVCTPFQYPLTLSLPALPLFSPLSSSTVTCPALKATPIECSNLV